MEVITNGGFESGNFNGWNVGIRPDRANGGLPYLFDTPNGWVVSNQPQTDGTLSLSPISGASAFHGFSGNPAGLQFFLSQPMNCNNLVSKALLNFTFDVVGGPQDDNAAPRRFEVWIRSSSGHDRAKVFSYSVIGQDQNPPQKVSLDIRSAFNSLGPTLYFLEFRGVVPEGDTGPALFVVDNVSLDLVDNRIPTVTCPPNRTVECTGPLTTVTLTGSASDPDGPLTLTWLRGTTVVGTGPTLTIGLPVGTHTFTFVATDIFGAMAMCDVIVTVVDTRAPTITCPANILVSTDPGRCDASLTLPQPTAVDDCDPTPTLLCTRSDNRPLTDRFLAGVTTITCKATDDAGNMSTCTFTVTVRDTVLPQITCPANITIVNDQGLCSTRVNYTTTFSDNCPGATLTCTPPPGSVFPLGTTTVTCTATDAAGNSRSCTFTVTVRDNQAPTIVCPPDITQVTDVDACSSIVTYAVQTSDNCPGPITTTCVPPSGTRLAIGMHTVVCTATDAAGNTSTCTFKITIRDGTPPTITCPPNRTVECGGNTTPAATGTATATDLCSPPVTISHSDSFAPGSCPNTGVITRTWRALDSVGNQATCVQTITIVDTLAPVLTGCPTPTLMLTSLDLVPTPATVTATDQCAGTVPVVFTETRTTTGQCRITILRTWKATDPCGNMATCTQTITVQLPTVVEIVCPKRIEVVIAEGVPGTNILFSVTATPGAQIRCVNQSGQVVHSGDFFAVGIHTITCTATDECGNTDTCTFTIEVKC